MGGWALGDLLGEGWEGLSTPVGSLPGSCVLDTPPPPPSPLARVLSSAPRRLQVSIDLISGLPFQTMDSWTQSLAAASQFSHVGHVSVYDLQARRARTQAAVGREGSTGVLSRKGGVCLPSAAI